MYRMFALRSTGVLGRLATVSRSVSKTAPVFGNSLRSYCQRMLLIYMYVYVYIYIVHSICIYICV